MNDLTRPQQRILDFISSEIRADRPPPTHQEIADHFGFRSTRAAACHLDALKRKGFIESEPGKVRALRLVSPVQSFRKRIVDIPVFGSIPAGFADKREQETKGCVSIDIGTLGIKPSPRTFALEVRGDAIMERYRNDLLNEARKKSESAFATLWATQIECGSNQPIDNSAKAPNPAGRIAIFHDYFKVKLTFQDTLLRTCVVGDPGAGKTTLLWDIINWISNRPSSPSLHISSLFPVYIPMSSVGFEKDLNSLIGRVISGKHDFEWWTSSRKIILLLDGLDEVRAGQSKRILHEINCLMRLDIHIVITTRSVDCPQNLECFQRFMLLDLDSSGQSECVSRCLTQGGQSELVESCINALNDRFRGVNGLKSALSGFDPLQRFLGRPVFLVLVIRFFARTKRLPTTVGPVFMDYFDSHFVDPNADRNGAREVVRRLLAMLATHFTFEKREAAMALNDVEKLCSDHLKQLNGDKLLGCEVSVPEILQVCVLNQLLTVDRMVVRFSHSTWQEFFCAVAVGTDLSLRQRILRNTNLRLLVTPLGQTEWQGRIFTFNILEVALSIASEDAAAQMLRVCLESCSGEDESLKNSILTMLATARGAVPLEVEELFLNYATKLLFAGKLEVQWLFASLTGSRSVTLLESIASDNDNDNGVRELACLCLGHCVNAEPHCAKALSALKRLSIASSANVRLGVIRGLCQTRETKSCEMARDMLEAEPRRDCNFDTFCSGGPELRISGLCVSKLLEHGDYRNRTLALQRCLTEECAYIQAATIYKSVRGLCGDKTSEVGNLLLTAVEKGDSRQLERCVYLARWLDCKWFAGVIAASIIHDQGNRAQPATLILEQLLRGESHCQPFLDAHACSSAMEGRILPPLAATSECTIQVLWVSEHEGDEKRFLRNLPFKTIVTIRRDFASAIYQLQNASFHVVIADDLYMSKGLDGSYLLGLCHKAAYSTILLVTHETDVSDLRTLSLLWRRSQVFNRLHFDHEAFANKLRALLLKEVATE